MNWSGFRGNNSFSDDYLMNIKGIKDQQSVHFSAVQALINILVYEVFITSSYMEEVIPFYIYMNFD